MELDDLKRLADTHTNIQESSKFNGSIKAFESLMEAKAITRIDDSLTDSEILVIVMLEGFAYNIIQDVAFGTVKSNNFTEALITLLDSALQKIPRTTCSTLYRNDDYDDYGTFGYKIGKIHHVKGYFTTSKDDFDNATSVKWIITPLTDGKTKAREIYKVYNHGYDCPYPEWQIEFERNTEFVVTNIEKGDTIDIIHITELCSE